MEEGEKISAQSSERRKKEIKPFLICFIIGCVIGFFAVAISVYVSAKMINKMVIYANYPREATERFESLIKSVIALGIARFTWIAFPIAIVLTGLGSKWNKKAGITVTSVIVAAAIVMVSCICGFFFQKSSPTPAQYEERVVGDFVVVFYDGYCEIKGTTKQGNSERFLVIPENIDGVRVDSLGYRSLAGSLDMISGDLTRPRIDSKVLEKIYFENAIDFYPWFGNEYIGSNFKKILYPAVEKYPTAASKVDIYYPRSVYENAVRDGVILSAVGTKSPNV